MVLSIIELSLLLVVVVSAESALLVSVEGGKVDTGIDVRTIVSGIAEHFTAEELPGKSISVIVNLAPRTIKGIESKGMVLLAEDENGKLIFVTPEQKIRNGSPVK